MVKFVMSYPVFPIHLNQGFGSNPVYYAKFLDDFGLPEKGHNGLDWQAIHGQPVYAPHDGSAFNVGPDDHGGEGVYIRTTTPDDNGDYHTTILWHLIGDTDSKFLRPINGLKIVKRGDLVGYANNTGAPFESTGDHLHQGHALCDANGVFKNRTNGFNGCTSPLPYFDGTYATDTVVNPAPPAANVALIATQDAQQGNITIANMVWSVVGIIRAFLGL